MARKLVTAIVLLDIILIMMAGGWILASLYRGMSNLDLWYNGIYITLNIATLILNLILIKSQP